MDKWNSEQIANGSNSESVNAERTKLRSYVRAGLVTRGKVLTTPFRKHIVTKWVIME